MSKSNENTWLGIGLLVGAYFLFKNKINPAPAAAPVVLTATTVPLQLPQNTQTASSLVNEVLPEATSLYNDLFNHHIVEEQPNYVDTMFNWDQSSSYGNLAGWEDPQY